LDKEVRIFNSEQAEEMLGSKKVLGDNAYKRQEVRGEQSRLTVVRFEVLTAVLMKIQVLEEC
jgi:hypothetical protein